MKSGSAPEDAKRPQDDDQLTAEARVKTGDFVSRSMMTYAGFAGFCVFALLSPDRLMILPQASIRVPLAGDVSFLAFMLVAPAALIGMRVYLEVYVQRWQELDKELPAGAEPKTISPLKHPLLRNFSYIVLYPLLPTILALFTWKAAAKDDWGDGFLFLTLVSAAAHLFQLVPCRWIFQLFMAAVFSGLLIGLVQTIGGVPHRGLNLAREDLNGAYLVGQNLSRANLTQANLKNAVLLGTNLKMAILVEADLQHARLTGAKLQGARLIRAKLQNADFQVAVLRGANLVGASFKDAEFAAADLRDTMVTQTNFEGAKNMRINALVTSCFHPYVGNKEKDKFRGPPIKLPDGIIPPKKHCPKQK